LGNWQALQAKLVGHRGPDTGVVPLRGFDDPANPRHRSPGAKEPPNGAAEPVELLAHRDSRGRPRTRSAIVFFWISSVPPPIRIPGTLDTNADHAKVPQTPVSATMTGPRSWLARSLAS